MVMEYLAGIDLGQVLTRDGPLPIETSVGFVLQACDAIAEAHSAGIVHRDLKPANLFLTARMDGAPLVKVLDFGVSKTPATDGAADLHQLTISGIVMGSPGYMSPEQVRSTKDVDGRADIWSLGVILYELLTGLSPFVGQTLGDTFAKITSEDPPPIRDVRPDVPPGLAAVIAKCLERKPEQRVQDVGALASILAPFAPRECIPLVESILRVSGRNGQPAGQPLLETMLAPPGAGSGQRWTRSNASVSRARTEPPWLRSGTSQPSSRNKHIVALIALGAVATAVVVIAVLARGRRDVSSARVDADPAQSAGQGSVVPVAPIENLPPSAVLQPAPGSMEGSRPMDAHMETPTWAPPDDGYRPGIPPRHLGQPPRQAPPRVSAHNPSSPTPSAKVNETDLY